MGGREALLEAARRLENRAETYAPGSRVTLSTGSISLANPDALKATIEAADMCRAMAEHEKETT